MSSARRDIKRELSDSSTDESSDEDHSQKGNDMNDDGVVAAGADILDIVDDVPTMGQPAPGPVKSLIIKLPATKTMKPGQSNGLKKIKAIAAGAGFLDLVNDVPTMGQPAPGPVKSLIIKLPATKTMKPGQSNGLKKIKAIAAGAGFLDLVNDVPTMGQPAPEPAKSLIIKQHPRSLLPPTQRSSQA